MTGWDPEPAALGLALERGALDAAAPSFAALAAGAGVLVLAAPLDATLALLAELAAAPPAAALIMDVASVKLPVAQAGAALPAFVATHPLAGSERSGPAAAAADLFAGRTWTYDADAPLAADAGAFVASLGAVPVALANAEHDGVLALTSHLPQLLAVVLGSRIERAAAAHDVARLSGTGLRSMLRLADSAWSVWRSILSTNGVPLAQEVRALAGILCEVADALEDGRSHELAPYFASASAARARLHDGRSPPEADETDSNGR